MNYKLSKYTHITELENCFALYNSLTESIAQVNNKKEFNELLNNIEDSELSKNLIRDEFIVPNNVDETRLANAKFMKKWANKDLTLTLLPSLECNFRCPYCYENFKDVRFSEDDIASIEKFVKLNINQYETVNIGWFGGEPLLEIDVIDKLSKKLIEVCRFFKKPYFSSITTNGYFLTPEVFKKMLRNRIYSYQITLDGLPKTHNNSRILKDSKEGTFDVILSNLRQIKQVKSGLFVITIRTNVTKEIYEDFDEYLKFLHGEFGDDSRFKFLFRLTGNWGGPRAFKMKKSLIKDVTPLYDKMMKSDYKLDYSTYFQALRSGVCETVFGQNRFLIKPGGTVSKCTCFLGGKRNELGELQDGILNLDKQKQADWDFQFDKIPKECFDCTRYASCFNMGCPVKNIGKEPKAKCSWESYHIDKVLALLFTNVEQYPFIRRY